jgi:hypothetical protein
MRVSKAGERTRLVFNIAGEVNDRAERHERASRIIGRFPDKYGATSLAREHDRYLDEAFE